MYKLSIITINYNNLEGLKRTIESIVNQTWQEFEYVIIDGGSTDGSAAYIESQSAHFDYWVSEPDKGIYNAMNKGIAKATGEYLLFLNSGDHLFKQNILAENHHTMKYFDLIYFDLQIIDRNECFINEYPDILTFSYFVKNTLPHPATFIKRNLFAKRGLYDESLKIVSDWKLLMVSVCKYGSSYLKVNKTMSVFYLDGFSSSSENRELLLKEREQVLNDEFAFFIHDNEEINYLRGVVSNLRKSRKINWLIKLGLIDKF